MNTANNKRRKESQKKIERVFLELLMEKEIYKISVSEICNLAKVNRSTFYANYIDIYDLADKVKDKLEQEVADLYQAERNNNYNSNDYLKILKHIKDNQLFYKAYFKLGYDHQYKITTYDAKLAKLHFNDKFIEYHMEFFKAGFNCIVKMWLDNNCKETPEEMFSIIQSEYSKRYQN